MKEQQKKAASLPPELVSEILLRLPVKDLLRFKSVCKTWNLELGSQVFIKSHLNRSLEERSSDGRSLNAVTLMDGSHLYSLDVLSCRAIMLHAPPIKLNPYNFQLVGYCNGLLCYRMEYFPYLQKYLSHEYLLYNPTTKVHRWLPSVGKVHFPNNCSSKILSKFGYDSTSDDYKVLSFSEYYNFGNRSWSSFKEYHVYSLNSDSWRRIETCPQGVKMISTRHNVFVNHAFHWIGEEGPARLGREVICAFHLGTEEYYTIPFPDEVNSDEKALVALKGCLHFGTQNFRTLQVWAMKKYGVKESWTKMLCLTDARLIELELGTWLGYLCPCAYLDGGSKILIGTSDCNRDFISCDLQNQTIIEKVEFADFPYGVYGGCVSSPWVDSLVSPYSPK